MLLGSPTDVLKRFGLASPLSNGGVHRALPTVALVLLVLNSGCKEKASGPTSDLVMELTDANFKQEVIESSQPVLVEFWAPWCRPCLEMAPAVEEVAEDFSGRAKVMRIRIDENQVIATEYDVDAPPAIVVFRAGKVVKRRTGKQTVKQLVDLLTDSFRECGLK